MATQVEPQRDKRDRDGYGAQFRSTTPAEDMRTVLLNRVSWGAVFAGVTVALVAQLILNMFGVGIGAATIDPATGDSPSPLGFSIVAAIWWTVSGILAAWLGGFTAGRMAGEPRKSTAAWHGLTAWAFSTLVVFYILTSAFTNIVSGTVNTMTDVTGAAAQAAAPVLDEEMDSPLASIQQQIQNLQQQIQGQGAGGTAAVDPQTQQQMAETADVAADNVSRAALLGALALLLGAVAAWFGGRAGAVNPMATDYRGRTDMDELVH